MNSDKIKGTIDDAAGRAKRQVGEWTGDTETQVEGAAQQVKGKAEKTVGNVRDALNNAGKTGPAKTGPTKTGPTRIDREIDDNRDRESVGERK